MRVLIMIITQIVGLIADVAVTSAITYSAVKWLRGYKIVVVRKPDSIT